MSHRLAELVAAVVAGDDAKVRALVHTGNSNHSHEGVSLLARAVSQGNTDVVVTLLEKGGASTLSRDPQGFSPLHRACSLEAADATVPLRLVELLLQHGANPNDINPTPRSGERTGLGRTPLILAAMRGEERVVRALVLAGAEVGYRDKKGMSALDYAAVHGRNAVVRYLLSVGAAAESALPFAARGRDGATTVSERVAFGDINALLCAPVVHQSMVSIR